MPRTDSSGVQTPVGTDAFNPIPQFTTWQDGNAAYNNFRVVDLDTDRTALAAPVLRDGLLVYVKATKLYWPYQGSAWGQSFANGIGPWTAYTPSFTNITASGVAFQWRREGELARVRVKLTVTGTSGNPEFSLPVAAVTPAHPFAIYNGMLSHISPTLTGGAVFQVAASDVSPTVVRMYGWGYTALSPGNPPNTHTLAGEFTYRIA